MAACSLAWPHANGIPHGGMQMFSRREILQALNCFRELIASVS